MGIIILLLAFPFIALLMIILNNQIITYLNRLTMKQLQFFFVIAFDFGAYACSEHKKANVCY